MCEYCLNESYQRNNYLIYGQLDVNAEGNAYIDNDDTGLVFTFNWMQEIKDKKYEKYGLMTKIMIRYCPWCGRKL